MADVLVRLRPRPGAPPPPNGAAVEPGFRLVVCPPSGAGAQYARPLLRAGVELWAVRYPGRETRIGEPFATDVTQLAAEAATPLAPLLADGVPTVLLGHSMGVGVAVETDRLLAQAANAGARPRLLALSARQAPDAEHPVHGEREQLRRLTTDDAALRAWVERLGGVPAPLLDDADFLAMYLPILRADLLASLDHAALPYAGPDPTPLLLISGDADPVAPPSSMAGWGLDTHNSVRSVVLRGGHHALVDDADGLYAALGAALQAEPVPRGAR